MKKKLSLKIRLLNIAMIWGAGLWIISCLPQQEIITSEGVELGFSDRVLVFDTVFAGFRSASQRLFVYNPNKNAMIISKIQFGNPNNTAFKVIVNGQKGNYFENIEIKGKDSLLLVIEANLQDNNVSKISFLYDSLLFYNQQITQNIKLLVWQENVNIISKRRISSTEIWTKGKAYILLDTLFVDPSGILNLQDSVRVYAFSNASLQISGQLNLQGTAQNNILITGFRRELEYENRTGQWAGIGILAGGKANIQFANIKNAVKGLVVSGNGQTMTPEILISNSKIQNMSFNGIEAKNASIQMINSLISNCVNNAISIEKGGSYDLNHCSITGYEFNFFRTGPCLLIQNISSPFTFNQKNCIVWGNKQEELSFGSVNGLNLSYSILKTQNQSLNQNQNLINKDPLFVDSGKQNFQLKINSPAINMAQPSGVLIDLLGKTRDSKPDMGAYEYIQ